jgi:hypothetical protein
MAIQHPTTVGDPVDVNPIEFFDDVLPKIVKAQEKLAHDINAVYCFDLTGEHGGKWTVDLHTLEVRRGEPETANLYLNMSATDFHDMMVGKLDLDRAIDDNRIDLRGQYWLLAAFGALLRPGEKLS